MVYDIAIDLLYHGLLVLRYDEHCVHKNARCIRKARRCASTVSHLTSTDLNASLSLLKRVAKESVEASLWNSFYDPKL